MSTSILTATNIVDMRNKMGLTRDDLAKMLGVSGKTVARWENPNSSEPPSGTAAIVLSILVSNTLKIPLDEGKPELIAKIEKMQEEEKINENPDTVFMLLNEATPEEKAEICKALKIAVSSDAFQISKEYRSAAGHTIGNWFRGDHDLPYKEILVDVANKLKPKGDPNSYSLGDGRSEVDIEEKIIDYFAEKIAEELNKMTPEERAKKMELFKSILQDGKNIDIGHDFMKELQKALATTTVTTSAVVSLLTGPLTASLFYSGALAGIWASIFGMSSSLLLLTGTGVGSLVSLPLLFLFLGSPSYKKTIPVTLQLINIRRRVTQAMA